MKKLAALLGFAAMFYAGADLKAQNYTSGIGAIADIGERGNMYGAQYKYFFGEYIAGEFAGVTNGENTIAQANFQFQYPVFASRMLDFYVGVGPGVMYGKNLNNNEKSFYFAPAGMAGLELSLENIPLSFSADWRPRVFVGADPSVETARFSAGVKYIFD